MQPDSIGPKYQQAVLLLSYVCTHPQDGKAQQYLEEAQRMMGKIEAMQPQKAADQSDLAMLHGFYYTAMIVMNPQQNGPRYYQQALDNFDKALKLNPNNEMAKQLQQQFRQGMEAQTK
jgi:tetratricopeptide (TPR) repeat protein